jgi:Family of unknown function (DUF6221)
MSSDGLAEFIRARLDEAEAAVRLVPEGSGSVYVCDPDGCVEQAREQWADGSDRLPNHHGTWSLVFSRDRALAEVEAKREIVDRCERHLGDGTSGDDVAKSVLRLLAWPDADHPDYRPADWRPYHLGPVAGP